MAKGARNSHKCQDENDNVNSDEDDNTSKCQKNIELQCKGARTNVKTTMIMSTMSW